MKTKGLKNISRIILIHAMRWGSSRNC